MNSLIEIDKLIKQAKKEGIDFGKGDPYNRLRYYTKIGWMPHMERKKTKAGDVKGHYPTWALERLIIIEKMKKQGMTNEQIESKITTQSKLQNIYEKVSTQEFKNKLTMYALVVAILFIVLNELGFTPFTSAKNKDILPQVQNLPSQIVDSGVSFIPSGKNRVVVKNKNIQPNSRVYVTFNQNYSPASRYWVSKIDPQNGFYVELDAPVFDNTEFTWWISN